MTKRGERRKDQRRRPRRWLPLAVIGGLVGAAVVGYFAYRAMADLPGVKMPDQGNRHVQTAADPHEPYNSDPPTSGPHLPYIAPWGVHTRPIPLELQVHNLEDRGVVVQYSCESTDLVAKLRDEVRTLAAVLDHHSTEWWSSTAASVRTSWRSSATSSRS